MDETLQLNGTWVRNRMVALGLTQWWVAEQIGVDRRTVMRWANGQVRTIRRTNAVALATVLQCRLEALLQPPDVSPLASGHDQRAAGLALAGAGLLDRLGPVHQWDVAEALLKATAVPDLPLSVLGSLYQQLAVACWRQDKLDEAQRHNDTALAFAERSDDRGLAVRALGSRANLRHWRGACAEAIADWRTALAEAECVEPRERASLHCNLGAALYETGHAEAGRGEIETALVLLREDGTPMQRSIALAHLALLELECGNGEAAAHAARRSEALARRGDYRRGLALGQLLLAEAAALAGDAPAASDGIARGLAAFAELGIAEGANHRVAGRAWRRMGVRDRAIDVLRAGLPLARDFPLELADLHGELALAFAQAGDADAARAEADRAAALYLRCGAPRKAGALAGAMSPHVTWHATGEPLP
ncbi:MAG: helix-turn-helix transcriptional regulator [Burkholderiales bacterium]